MHKNYLIEIQRNEKAYVATLLSMRMLGNKLSLHWLGRSTAMENTKKSNNLVQYGQVNKTQFWKSLPSSLE